MTKEKLFRLSIGSHHDPQVDAWFDARPDELGHMAKTWFEEIRALGDDVLELIHDGCPVACIEDVPFANVNVYTAHINVGLFLGALLPDPANLIQGTGKRMRHVRIGPTISFDPVALRTLLQVAYADIKQRLN
ncbi:MAG: hypothetical protein KDI19_11450 [Pseudomonadales bacterium]|nr:hypothetical protein [Pseudomonadales bacterium]